MCVAWMHWSLRDTDDCVDVLDQAVREFDILKPTGDWHCLTQSASTWIWFVVAHRRLTFSPWSYSIRMYVNLILRAYRILNVVVLDQLVREPDLLELIGDWHSRCGFAGSGCTWFEFVRLTFSLVFDQIVREYDFSGPIGVWHSHHTCACTEGTWYRFFRARRLIFLLWLSWIRKYVYFISYSPSQVGWHSRCGCSGPGCTWI